MPSYADDDTIDYQNEMPDFQDEAEFDDYLNDEEYELISELFPKAKKELEDYQGWDNLAVKLAIFDTDFDLPEALAQLKRSYKKKKAPGAPLQKVKNAEVSLGPQFGTMSKLELLARSKAQAAQSSNSTDVSSSRGLDCKQHDTSRSISLLSRLQKSTPTPSKKQTRQPSDTSKEVSEGTPSALGSKLAFLSGKKNGSPSITRKVEQASLSSKLQALRRPGATANQSSKTVSKDKVQPKSIEKGENQLNDKKSLWEAIHRREVWLLLEKTRVKPSTGLLDMTKIVLQPSKENDSCKEVRKRNYSELFSVFFPSKRYNTNNYKTAQQQAASNFRKPSPDDIILNAQANVFKEVKDNISNLKISNKENASAVGDWDESDEEKTPDKAEELPKQYKKVVTPTKPRDPINLENYLNDLKPHCSFVVLGHVDAGKSTLMGRLLYDIGAVDINHIRKLKKESERIGKGSFHLAWVMDQTPEERERGVTVSICTSDFETEADKFTIVDAPGHRDFVPSAIAGISQADVALLSIDCGTDAFESGFNLDGQTKEHTLLARSMGVGRIIVAMNKMDSVDWDSTRFHQIKSELGTFFADIGLKEEQISWVPCSGLSGEGVYKKPYPKNQSWYTGPNLVEQLEIVAKDIGETAKKGVIDSAFLFSVLEVIPSSKNEEASVTGRVESGSIQPGETITLYPSGQSVLVDKILTGNDKIPSRIAIKGDFITLKLRHAYAEDIEAGDLGASVDYEVEALHSFTVQLLTFNMDRPLLPGTPFILFRGVCQQPARITKLESLVDKSDPSKILKKKIRHLGSNQAAVVELELTERKRWIPTLTFSQNKHLGRVLLRKDGRTIAAGAVMH